jgi:glutaredoxin-related protein
MKIYFISFGSTHKYSNSINRIKQQAINMNIFNEIFIYTEKDFDKDFLNKHSEFIKTSKKGYGYWLWKSYFTRKTLNIMDDGDILIYADAGCSLVNTPTAIKRLQQYITLCNRLENANISFQMCFPEKTYSKMDLFHKLDVYNDNMLNSGQLVGGIFILKKCPKTIKLIDEYYELSQDYHLIDDSPSTIPNDSEFIDNRHDQSLFSILRKKHGTILIPDETWFPDFRDSKVLNFPILATRIRN